MIKKIMILVSGMYKYSESELKKKPSILYGFTVEQMHYKVSDTYLIQIKNSR